MDKKIMTIVEGAALIVLGILLAIFGGQAVLDVYFGIIFVIAGVLFLAVCIIGLLKTKELIFGFVFAAAAFLLFGIFLLTKYYSFAAFVYAIILLIIAGGIALFLFGIWSLIRVSLFLGIGQMVVGAAVATLGFCYIFIPEFYATFWIIAGIIVALYGVFYVLSGFFNLGRLTGKKEQAE